MAQPTLPGLTLEHKGGDWYEHAVLVTNWLEQDLLAVAQIYRDRAGAENLFDELKNQWGWTGFTTQDLRRSQLMARIVALIYNWWSIFTRMATGASHGKAKMVANLLSRISSWLKRFQESPEQLDEGPQWGAVLRWIFQDFGGFRSASDSPNSAFVTAE